MQGLLVRRASSTVPADEDLVKVKATLQGASAAPSPALAEVKGKPSTAPTQLSLLRQQRLCELPRCRIWLCTHGYREDMQITVGGQVLSDADHANCAG